MTDLEFQLTTTVHLHHRQPQLPEAPPPPATTTRDEIWSAQHWRIQPMPHQGPSQRSGVCGGAGAWQLRGSRQYRARLFVMSDPDHFPYLLQDVLNFDQFSSNLTNEEQQQLLNLNSMFASPQFKENISSFQKLHVEGVFDLSLSEDQKCSSINEGSVVQGGPNAIANGNSTNVKRLRDGQLQNSPGENVLCIV
ncbi:hypothetical protein RHMOL_Rhmol10G0304800 [Rhododendron molle]|uniref:Uncharacterized protein n=2 Tax=Rhododendron molle TaxID=49168 RepID=A0ACC0M7W2_RHOML|nr:hypothetical protein RHMOL_Rhmol10G0304800 [Rhododendron molle]KAI8537055.1 hypothetical protein RHMOL_Rhmol10G0304800 [Rhododendron molle]